MFEIAANTCLMVFVMCAVDADAYSKVCPSALTQTYSSMVTGTARTSSDMVVIASTSQSQVSMWVNTPFSEDEVILDANTLVILPLPTGLRMSPDEAESNAIINIVSPHPAVIFLKNDHAMYQMRETSQLAKEYITVSYSPPDASETWNSTIGIAALFSDAIIRLTFRAGIDVEDIFSHFTNETRCGVTGQRISCKSTGATRYVMQIHSRSDLSGTKITSSKDISVVAGAVSQTAILDHMVPLDSLALSYTVFGFPGGNGSCVCRIVATSGLTDVTIDGVNTERILSERDYKDVNISGEGFHTINASNPILVAMVIENSYSSSPALVVAYSAANISHYTFTLIRDETNENLKHYIVVPDVPQGGLLLNGEALPNETLCMAVGGTVETGCFVPVHGFDELHSVSSIDGEYFTAYLIGSGDSSTFGSALIGTKNAKYWYEPPRPLSLNKSYCTKSGGQGNYISNGTNVQMATMEVKTNKRLISYNIKHMRMPSAEACQLSCFLYKGCQGVNYNTVSMDCDIVFDGFTCTDYTSGWKYFNIW
ncbi:uncharacterized protein [Haliotis asinina]|uniref:uncharacterized protein n=1 Tax=Haliotis asinina TaxID=109174 RepID=UPI00353197C4